MNGIQHEYPGHPALQAAWLPPSYSVFDVFPFSLLVRHLTKRGKEVTGKKAAKLRARRGGGNIEGNVPLEITLYLVSDPEQTPYRHTDALAELLHRSVAEPRSRRGYHR